MLDHRLQRDETIRFGDETRTCRIDRPIFSRRWGWGRRRGGGRGAMTAPEEVLFSPAPNRDGADGSSSTECHDARVSCTYQRQRSFTIFYPVRRCRPPFRPRPRPHPRPRSRPRPRRASRLFLVAASIITIIVIIITARGIAGGGTAPTSRACRRASR